MKPPVFLTLPEAVEWIIGPTKPRARMPRWHLHWPEPISEEEYRAVDAIESALRAGAIHARGALPNGMGQFVDIPIEFWQYAMLDVGRTLAPGRSPITERSHAMPVFCYDRIILWREEVEACWPKPNHDECCVQSAPPAPPRPWWRRILK